MGGELFSGVGRDLVEMIDERFNKPVRTWTLGTWVFLIIVVAVAGLCISVIAEHILVPLWHFAEWLSTGKLYSALHDIDASLIFRTVLYFGIMVFLTAGGFIAVRGVVIVALQILKSKESLSSQIAQELTQKSRASRLLFWPQIALAVAMMAMLYIFGAIYVTRMIVHDMGLVSEFRAAIAKCLPVAPLPNPVRLELQERTPQGKSP